MVLIGKMNKSRNLKFLKQNSFLVNLKLIEIGYIELFFAKNSS